MHINVNESREGIVLNLPGQTSICFSCSEGKVEGIRRVTVQGYPLRNERECIFPELATPDGMEIDHYTYEGWHSAGDAIVIQTKPWFRVAHRMEWSEHAMHLRIHTGSWSTGPKSVEGAFLNWVIRPCQETIGGREYTGFSYGFEYHCPGYSIYQIEDKATWELGGDVSTNSFVMKGGGEHPIVDFAQKESYDSGSFMLNIDNPYIFQHMPLYTQLQGFTFQYDDSHILLTRHEKPSHVRSMFYREKGDLLLLHFNQFCFDLTDQVQTPERKILLCDCGKECFTDRMNHFLRIREQIQGEYRSYYGVKTDIARPDAHVETWEIAKMENFPPILKKLTEWGIHRSFIMPLWRSNTTEVLPRFEEDAEKYGILGNMCCPFDLEIAPCHGGDEGMRRAFSCTKELGMETYIWFGSHFSSVTDLEKKIPDLFARDVSGQQQRNNYGHVLRAVDQNNPAYREYLLARFEVLKQCGIAGVFRDSHFNMASDTINYLHVCKEQADGGTVVEDQVRSMHDTELSIQKAFQEKGLLYYVESMGIFGTPMSGTNYNQVIGSEFIYQNMSSGLDAEKVAAHGISCYEAYFRCMAVRMFYQLHVEVNQYPKPEALDGWWDEAQYVPLLKAYENIEPYLQTMWLMPNDMGIKWTDESGHVVVFAYQDGVVDIPESTEVQEVIEGMKQVSDGQFKMEKLKIYHWIA